MPDRQFELSIFTLLSEVVDRSPQRKPALPQASPDGTRLAGGPIAAEDGEACLQGRRSVSARGKSGNNEK